MPTPPKRLAANAATKKIAAAAAQANDLITNLAPIIQEAADVVHELNHVIDEIRRHDLDIQDVIDLVEEGWELASAIGIAVASRDLQLGGSGNIKGRIRALSRWWRATLAQRQAAMNELPPPAPPA